MLQLWTVHDDPYVFNRGASGDWLDAKGHK